jgi:hypothetical protein
MAQSQQALKTKITEAFQKTVYPGDENLVPDAVGDPECIEIARTFKGKEWQSVPPEIVHEHKDALPLFTPAAFCYYLPAYLMACIDAREQIDVAWDSVIIRLTPPKNLQGSRMEFFRTRAEGFSPTQAEALLAFLEFAFEKEKADWAREGLEPQKDFPQAIKYWKARTSKIVG